MKKTFWFPVIIALMLLLAISVCTAEATQDSSETSGSPEEFLSFPGDEGEAYEIFTDEDGERYDLFEIRKLFYDQNHKVYAVSGVYERIAMGDDCYYSKQAKNGTFTYDLAPDCRMMMINPETWDLLDEYVPVQDLYAWYLDAYLGGEEPESGELVFRYDLPEDEQESAEVDFWFITTRIRLNEQQQIEYMRYFYVPWA